MLSVFLQERVIYLGHLIRTWTKQTGNLDLINVAVARKKVIKALLVPLAAHMTAVAGWSCSAISQGAMHDNEGPLASFLKGTAFSRAADYRALGQILKTIHSPYVWTRIARFVLLHPTPNTVNDRYILQRDLYEAKIFRAMDVMTGVPHVIKVQDLDTAGEMLDEYLATQMASCTGTGLFPRLVDTGSVLPLNGESPLFAMVLEQCHADLQSRLHKQNTVVPWEMVRELLVDLLQGLSVLHSDIGLVHGDVKLDNIMRTSRGTACLIDFGLTVPIGAVVPGRHLYTKGYKAPEIARAGRTCVVAVPSMDIFALGVTMILHLFPAFYEIFPGISARLYARGFKQIELALTLVEQFYGSFFSHLLRRMVSADPTMRPTAAELLAQPILRAGPTPTPVMAVDPTGRTAVPYTRYRYCAGCWEVARPFMSLPRELRVLVEAVAQWDRGAFADIPGFLQSDYVLPYTTMLLQRTGTPAQLLAAFRPAPESESDESESLDAGSDEAGDEAGNEDLEEGEPMDEDSPVDAPELTEHVDEDGVV